MAEQTIIQTGSTYRLFDAFFKSHDALPVGTYHVEFNPMSGHSLHRIDDLTASSEKMYGNGRKRVKRIIKGYEKMGRSYGVLMSGDGGMGKTMLMRELVSSMQKKFSLPIIVVDTDSPGIVQFLDSLDECIVVFDEFEKNFPSEGENEGQAQFLTLFDGLSSTKRMYVVTVNSLTKLNDYIVNRTGRFHAHLRFDYPDSDMICEYLVDAGVSKKAALAVAEFSLHSPLNYDHLRAIAFELVQVGGDFSDIITDLNIKRTKTYAYNVTLTFADGSTYTGVTRTSLSDEAYVQIDTATDYFAFKIDMDQAHFENGSYILPPEAIVMRNTTIARKELKAKGKLTAAISLVSQPNLSF